MVLGRAATGRRDREPRVFPSVPPIGNAFAEAGAPAASAGLPGTTSGQAFTEAFRMDELAATFLLLARLGRVVAADDPRSSAGSRPWSVNFLRESTLGGMRPLTLRPAGDGVLNCRFWLVDCCGRLVLTRR